ncbi:MAG: type II toxin-antitoxin system VapB family antitoxin [Geminicoccaceae bacterium]
MAAQAAALRGIAWASSPDLRSRPSFGAAVVVRGDASGRRHWFEVPGARCTPAVCKRPTTLATCSTLFGKNRTQAVRLPKAVALPEELREVEIEAVGPGRFIVLAGRARESFFDLPATSDDFLTERDDPAPEPRQSL